MRINFSQATELLLAGQVVAMPTETVYGLAACLNQPLAIEQIFKLKGRPLTNPLIIHVAHPNQVEAYASSLPPHFHELVATFWPGPLTLIVPIQESLIPSLIRAHLPTAAFRMPQHELTLQVLQKAGPVVMPSANLSGRPSATRPKHVEEDFGEQVPVLDGGSCLQGLESTILYYEEPQWSIVRLGALTATQLVPILGYEPAYRQAQAEVQPICPGQLLRHYAPQATLILGEPARLEEASFILGFDERSYPSTKQVISLGSLNQVTEVAENLYEALRQLDQQNAKLVWVDMDFPRQGLWATIAERLYRASQG